ncbi:MAG: cell envelope integrity protein TolA [Gammaproteobacteria bacterium]|nr:cell envelope integrity protein TolA [Gammaproteobacteria bacterium]MDH5629854.1 cell envelope integrity protein TolA [Gammaproteobacteria bacterium]
MKLTTAIVISVLVHAVLIVLVAFNFYTITKVEVKQTVSKAPKIHAKAVDSKQIDKLKQQKKEKEKKEKDRVERIKKEKEQARLKKLADEKLKKEEAERKKKEAEETKKRKEAEEKAAKEALEQEMLAQMEADVAELANARENQILTEIDKYKNLIDGKIKRNWIAPEIRGFCIFRLKLAPGGLLLTVEEVEGDSAHCESGQRAIYKSEPLPVPKEPDIFEQVRNIKLTLDNRIQEQDE